MYTGPPTISVAGWRWDSGTVYGNRLVNSNEYYGSAGGDFVPAGHGEISMGALESSYFYCYGTSNCRF